MMDAQVGDWVRFYRNEGLVIGQIEYIFKDPVLGGIKYCTSRGSIDEADVLERRSKP